jgi:hypothetical protein
MVLRISSRTVSTSLPLTDRDHAGCRTLYFKICSRRPNNELSSARLVPIFFSLPSNPFTPLLSVCFPSQKTANDKQRLYNGTRRGGIEYKKAFLMSGIHTHTNDLPFSIGSLNYSILLRKRKRNAVYSKCENFTLDFYSPPQPFYIKIRKHVS